LEKLKYEKLFHIIYIYNPQEISPPITSFLVASGHTESWELGHPGLLTPCYRNGVPNGEHGPMDPTKKSTFDFLQRFFKEITTVFPDKYVHIGGDEVNLECW
jgi:hypothetical protein